MGTVVRLPHVGLVNGTVNSVQNWRKQVMDTSVENSNSSLGSQGTAGIPVPPSGQDVAPVSIPIEFLDASQSEAMEISRRAVRYLLAMHVGLLGQVTDREKMETAVEKGKELALLMGVSEQDFQESLVGLMGSLTEKSS